jgi:hypothetical protein
MLRAKWIVAAVACAGLLGCQTTPSGPGTQGGGNPAGVTEYICKKDESPCRIDTTREWIAVLFPRASVQYERLVFAPGNKGDVLWVLPNADFYFESDGITFADGGANVFRCNLVNPQSGQSQQILCSLTSPPATGSGKKEYKYSVKIHYKGWYFVWPHDPWVID